MPASSQSPWSDTPPIHDRVVTAISRVATVMRAGMWQFATSEGLNPTQAEILHLLYTRGTGMRLSWIAQQMAISPASASDSVTSLVTKGLVRKSRDPHDGRALALVLTSQGKALAARVGESVHFAADAIAAMPQASQQNLLAGLLKMIGELQKSDRFAQIRACPTCAHFEPNRHDNPAAPHYCHLVGAPLPAHLLRMDCPEHQPADPSVQTKHWKALG